MSAYLRLRAVPAPALRNSPTWLERLFTGTAETVLPPPGLHCEDVLDQCRPDQGCIYADASPHGPDVVLGGHPVFRADRHGPPLLVLTAARTRGVAGFLTTADFDELWNTARHTLLPRYGGEPAEPETRRAFAEAHQELTTFYAHTAEHGDAVVKWPAEA
ncbi:DUF1877 family protein [Streptomyces sp. NPDC048278]|uniref:DUF1877 family protein n=1 Tax=Streptomyces sp. NPDC048278 TaxID=3155809 RepID=UPI0034161330